MAENETLPPTNASAGFDDWEEFANALTLRIKGKLYTIPEPDVEKAKMILAYAEDPKSLPAEIRKTNEAFWRWVLTDELYERMIADKVPAKALDRAVLTALYDVVQGRAGALIIWKVGRDPEALAALTGAADRLTAGSNAAKANGTSSESPSTSSTSPDAPTSATRKRTARSGTKSSRSGATSAATSSASTTTGSRRRTRGAGSAP